MVSLKLSQSRQMGDLVVLTFSRAVADWASEVAHLQGALGTALGLKPIVLLLSDESVGALLDEAHPELAFFAAWAMQERHGPQAKVVVRRALQLTECLDPPLRDPMRRAILSVLDERMTSFLKELEMDIDQIPEGAAVRRFKADAFAEGKAEGQAEAILDVLEARGLRVSAPLRARILATTDTGELSRLLRRAVVTESAEDL